MNRFVKPVLFAAFVMFAAVGAFAQGTKGFIPKKAWYVDTDKKIFEAVDRSIQKGDDWGYWRIYLGDYDVKLKRNIAGEGQITVDAGMNFQLFSAGFIEGNGHSAKGKMQSLPGMRIVADGGQGEEFKIDAVDYIYDYGTKVVLKDGRRGNFMIGGENGELLEVKRFQLSVYTKIKGRFGEEELKETKDRLPIIGISFTKEGAARAASEAVSDY
jgi:hypothetical protein